MNKQYFFLLAALAASASASFGGEVKCTRAPMALETYPVGAPEKNPMFAEKGLKTPFKIDYFATSLPLLLIFEDDLEAVKNARMENLESLAEKGLESCK